jgi:hypothetical protein
MTFSFALLLAVACGAASAALAGGALTGAAPASLLMLVAPLPILWVGLYAFPLVALLSALVAAIALKLVASDLAAYIHLATVGAPAFALTFLLMMRGGGRGFREDGHLGLGEIGVLLVILASVAGTVALAIASNDYAGLRQALADLATSFVAAGGAPLPDGVDVADFARSYALLAPAVSLVQYVLVLILLCWIAARLARRGGRLARPWPDIAGARLPPFTLALLGAALFVSAVGGWTGLFAGLVAAGIGVLFMLMGLAVLHVRARDFPQQRWLVPAGWAALLILSPFLLFLPVVGFVALGVADHVFDFRRLVRQPR